MITTHVDACVDPVELLNAHACQVDTDSNGHLARPSLFDLERGIYCRAVSFAAGEPGAIQVIRWADESENPAGNPARLSDLIRSRAELAGYARSDRSSLRRGPLSVATARLFSRGSLGGKTTT